MEKHVRTPIIDTIRKSPFDGLFDHADKVRACIDVLRKATELYCDEKYETFNGLVKEVSRLEHEADVIKGNTRNHLPKNIFMPVEKSDFLMCLREQDSILDYAEDTVLWLTFRKTEIPDEIKKEFLDHLYKVVETVEAFEKVVSNVKDLVAASFSRKEREQTKDMIKDVHQKEWEADQIERGLTKKIFNLNMDPMSIYHLLKVVNLIAEIANHAENAGDRVRAMVAK